MTLAAAIQLGLQLGQALAVGIPAAIAAKREIDAMLAEGRDPTDAEWERLTAITDALHRQVQEG